MLHQVPVHVKRLACLIAICGSLSFTSLFMADGREADNVVTFIWAHRLSFITSVVWLLLVFFNVISHEEAQIAFTMQNIMQYAVLPCLVVVCITCSLIQMSQSFTSIGIASMCLIGLHDLTRQQYQDQTQTFLHGCILLLSLCFCVIIESSGVFPLSWFRVIQVAMYSAIPAIAINMRQREYEDNSKVTVLQMLLFSAPQLFSVSLLMSSLIQYFIYIKESNFEAELSYSMQHTVALVIMSGCLVVAVYAFFQSVQAGVTTDFAVALSLTYSLRQAYVEGGNIHSLVCIITASLGVVCMVVCQWGGGKEESKEVDQEGDTSIPTRV